VAVVVLCAAALAGLATVVALKTLKHCWVPDEKKNVKKTGSDTCSGPTDHGTTSTSHITRWIRRRIRMFVACDVRQASNIRSFYAFDASGVEFVVCCSFGASGAASVH
jgi:hypothetical protein